jgi:hypothetical protein
MHHRETGEAVAMGLRLAPHSLGLARWAAANNILQWKEQPHPHTLCTLFLDEKLLLAAMITSQNYRLELDFEPPFRKKTLDGHY